MLCVECLRAGRSAIPYDRSGNLARGAAQAADTITGGEALCLEHVSGVDVRRVRGR